jgi:hypothetical protein
VGNNPIRFNDPTGHFACGDGEEKECGTGKKQDPIVDPYKPPKKDKDDESSNQTNEPEEDLKIEEQAPVFGPYEFIISSNPIQENACRNGNLNQSSGPSTSKYLREFCGKFDPTLLNPELGGTNLSYGQLVMGVAEYLGPNNPLSRLGECLKAK